MDLEALAGRVKAGDSRGVSRLITLIENQDADGTALLKRLQPSNSKAAVIGITGYPGAGKSTLIAQLVTAYRRQNMKVAILAIDTSSPVSGGAILGDRIRMQEHCLDSGVFIRRPQLQCRDYLIAGPYKSLKQYKPQDWNEMVVTVKAGAAYCTCNGEVLEAALNVPATGPIGLEGDRGQMEYRHIRLQELP